MPGSPRPLLPQQALLVLLLLLVALSLGASSARSGRRFILQAPTDQEVRLKESVLFTCIVNVSMDQAGNRPQVYWSKDQFGIGGTPEDMREFTKSQNRSTFELPNDRSVGDYSLLIRDVRITAKGQYTCQVHYKGTQVESSSARLTVLIPSTTPRLYQLTAKGDVDREVSLDRPATVYDGEDLRLRCVALNGYPGARLFWLNSGLAIRTDERGFFENGNISYALTKSPNFAIFDLSDATSDIQIRLNRLRHDIRLGCRASNRGFDNISMAENETRVIVQYGPDVSVEVQPATPENLFSEGDKVRFVCTAVGRPNKFTWSWSVDDVLVAGAERPIYETPLSRTMDGATVTCKAASVVREKSSSVQVFVRYGPRFDEPSALLYTASVGDRVVMNCSADGKPTPRVEWISEGRDESFHVDPIFTIPSVAKNDFGTFICKASVAGFTPVTKKMYLIKQQAPKIDTPLTQHAVLGRPAKIRCKVDSVPPPQIDQVNWYFNGRQLREDTKYHFEREEFIRGVVLVMNVNDVDLSDFGEYNCSVSNGFGEDHAAIRLVVSGECGNCCAGVIETDSLPLNFVIGATVAALVTFCMAVMLYLACRKNSCFNGYNKANNRPGVEKVIPASMLLNHHHQAADGMHHPYHGVLQASQRKKGLCKWLANGQQTSSCASPVNSYSLPQGSANSGTMNSFIRYGHEYDDRASMTNGSLLRLGKYGPTSSNGDVHHVNVDFSGCSAESMCHYPRVNGDYLMSTASPLMMPKTVEATDYHLVNGTLDPQAFQLLDGTPVAYVDAIPVMHHAVSTANSTGNFIVDVGRPSHATFANVACEPTHQFPHQSPYMTQHRKRAGSAMSGSSCMSPRAQNRRNQDGEHATNV